MVEIRKKISKKNISLGDKIFRFLRIIEKSIIDNFSHPHKKHLHKKSLHKRTKHRVIKQKTKSRIKKHPHKFTPSIVAEQIIEPVIENKKFETVTEKPIVKKIALTNILSQIKFDDHMRILVVEDEEVLFKVMEEKFEKTNLKVKVATDGESALNYAQNFKPNIILLDINIPKIDGFGVLKALKENPETKDIPVIVASNLNEDTNITQALKLGANDYFVKSNHPINEIIEKVKAVLLNNKPN